MSAMRIVGYTRISRDVEESTSIARQREVIADTASARGWTVVEIAEDLDVSATKTRLDRPALSRVRELIRSGDADAVLVWRLDRLARSVVDFGTLLDEGVQVVSATEPLDTTSSMGRAMAEIIQVFAAMEARTIGERTRSARAYRARNHRHGGGAAPYGYRSVPHPDGDGRALEVDPGEAAYVRMAADVVLDGGTLYRAVQTIREAGSTPRRAAVWSLSSLRVVLTGESVLGRLTFHGKVVRDDSGMPVTPWEPILPLADVERLRAALATKPRGKSARKASRLLSGLVFCAGCEARMRVSGRQSSSGRSIKSYACNARSDGRDCPHPATISAERLEEHIEGVFMAAVGKLPVTEHIEVSRDVPELAEVVSALSDLGGAITEPGADVAVLAAQIAGLHARRSELEALPREPVVEVRETGESFSARWQRAGTDERRRLLSEAIDSIDVRPGVRGRRGLDPERLTVNWRS